MRAAAYTFIITLYFFLILSISGLAAQNFQAKEITIGISKNSVIEDINFKELQECTHQACQKWEKSGLVKFKYNKNPSIIINSWNFPRNNIGQYQNSIITIRSKIYPQYCYKKWDKKLLEKVLIHEIGHALGLSHSELTSDIMYYRVTDTDKPSKNDFERLKKVLYKK